MEKVSYKNQEFDQLLHAWLGQFTGWLSPASYGLAFFDAANGWYDFKNYNPFQLRRSVGLGARFFLPMFGLLGFDYGVGLDRITPGGGLKNASRFTFMLGFEPE